MLLGAALGGVMTQWPYPQSCGWPLVGYLGAVGTVILSGAWIAFASWKLRSGLVHILSLILIFWGIVLAAEQLLPRIGYAADRASWACPPELFPQPQTTRPATALTDAAR
jgi:heme A synthase